MAPYQSLGTWMKQQRKALDLTQEALADQVGYALSTVRKIESGVLRPSREVAERLADCLALPPTDRASFVRLARSPLQNDRASHIEYTHPSVRSVIPAPTTPLVARDDEVAAISRLLSGEGVRLVTLYGPAGIGKTRLAIQAAGVLRDDNSEVFFVSLSAISDPELVLAAIAQTVGVSERRGMTLADSLKHRLGERRVALVLDTFDPLLPARGVAADLLAGCPNIRILVTSRAVLHLYGEQQFPVPPLSVPGAAISSGAAATQRGAAPTGESWETLEEYGAVALFVNCARAILPSFRITPENAAAVASICSRLDGLPLAIELIAARIKLLSPQALAARLDKRLTLLTSQEADRPARHQTLRAAIDWSHSLLTADEQRVFARLSVFVGGCSLEAAEAIVPDPGEDLDVADCIASLLDKSMLHHAAIDGDEPRFMMLDMMREYAAETLAARGESPIFQFRHAGYYGALAETAAPSLHGDRQQAWLDTLDLELDNLRAALGWYAQADAGAGSRLAIALCHFWHARGDLSEARGWYATFLARLTGAQALRAELLSSAGYLASQQGDQYSATTLAEESLGIYRALGDEAGIAGALYVLGNVALFFNQYERAMELYAEALPFYDRLGNRNEAAQVLKNMGLVAKDQGDYARAAELIEESLRLRRASGDARGSANSLINLSIVAYWQAQYERAMELGEEALALYRQLGDKIGAAYALDSVGMVAYKRGDYARARAWLDEGLALFRATGDHIGTAMILSDIGYVAQAAGDRAEAQRLQREALVLAKQLGEKRRMAFCLEGLAAVLCAAEPRRATQLCGAAAALRVAIGAPVPPGERKEYDDLIAELRRRLGAAAWRAAWEEGETRPLAEWIASL